MRNKVAGFSAIELVSALAIMGVMTSIAYPHLHAVTTASAVRSAKLTAVAYIERTRAAAVQNGREARFVRVGDAVQITVDSNGTQVTVVPPRDFYAEHQVHLVTTRDTIAFDPRGFAVGLNGLVVVRLNREDVTDSVCVTRLGKIAGRKCSL
jgi:prepilin-type N-terminal cleavage/methylation domain-containing protein